MAQVLLALADRGDVVEADLTARDELVVIRPPDLDLPELLRAALLDRDRVHIQRTRPVGTNEIGGIVDADRAHPLVVDGGNRARSRERLDDGGVEPAVNDSGRLVVSLVDADRAADPGGRHLVEVDVEQLEERAVPAAIGGAHLGPLHGGELLLDHRVDLRVVVGQIRLDVLADVVDGDLGLTGLERVQCR